MLMPCDPVDHRRRRRGVLRVLLGRRIELRLPDRRPRRRLRTLASNVQLGTTNVDYSWDLYHHFQALRTYRETRFRVDPAGLRSRDAAARPTIARRRSTCPPAGCAGSCRSRRRWRCRCATRDARRARRSIRCWPGSSGTRRRPSPRALRFELLAGQAAARSCWSRGSRRFGAWHEVRRPGDRADPHLGHAAERDEMHLLRAIELAHLSRANGNHPFGSLLVDGSGRVVLEAENTALTEDLTAHAEFNVVRAACRQFDVATLEGATLYSATEPCAMCSGAIYWSGIGRVVYALGRHDDDVRQRRLRIRDVGTSLS